ncbi:Outer membrane protein TolC [Abditibacterium utsteinense]|uniref:Outer membrane protein TolC n=1 Tax=Abditibacterium utsteinense TaxID=1960156 RepID=A0A2S8SUG0_9BACT|nr:TolC family protein [Abditibacterium utsteinense]PQV64418.1 Outer membrane protein TolC [Abditibacterium utsteinense]
MNRTSFASLGLLLALSGVAIAQDAAKETPNTATPNATSPNAAAPDLTAPIEGGVATDGTQGAAGGSSQNLVPVPQIEAAGLADVRLAQAQDAPEITLEAAVLEALQNNPTPKAARAQLDSALARIGIARSQGKPTANLGASSQYQRSVGNVNNGSTTTTGTGTGTGTDGTGTVVTTGGGGRNSGSRSDQLSLNVSLPVFTGGRVKNSRRQAEAAARAQLATAQQTEQELAAQTILSYLSILQSGELLQVAQSNLDTSRERRRVAGVRFDAGAAARLEVLRADSDLSSAAQRRIAAANSYIQSKSALNILLARDPETPLRVQPIQTLTLPTAVNFPLAEQANAIAAGGTAPASSDLRAAAETSLPSLGASRETVKAAEFGVKTQQSARKPNIAASLTGLLRNPATFVSRFLLGAGISVAQTLFSGGRIASQVAEARGQLSQTQFNLQGQRLQVANAIEGSLLSLDSALKRTTSADTAVISGQEALRAAQLAYTAGAGTQLDVIDAQNALVAAQTDAVNARYEIAQAQVQLAAATAITQGGSATGRSGLGSSAGTGQSASFSASGATQFGGSNSGNGTTGTNSQFGGNSQSGQIGTNTGTTGTR